MSPPHKASALYRYFPLLLIAMVVVVLFPKSETYFYLFTDDFRILSTFLQPQTLLDKNLLASQPSSLASLTDPFNFFSAHTGSLQELREYGAMPWWTPDNTQMHMFRPLAAATHWFDANWFYPNITLLQFHNLVWVLLLALSSYCFYTQFFEHDRQKIIFATLIFTFNFGLLASVYWLAARNAYIVPIFTFWTLIFHKQWRDTGKLYIGLLSLISLSLALLTAEAGICTAAYLGAYALILDRKGPLTGLICLVPAAAITVLWRLYYQHEHYGADNIALYVDPIRDPIGFISNIFETGPLLFLSQLIPINIPYHLPENLFLALVVFASLAFIISTVISLPVIRKNRLAAFFMLGSLFSIVPFCAYTSIQIRNIAMISIGFSAAVVIILFYYWQLAGGKFTRFFAKSIIVAFLSIKLLMVLPHIAISLAPTLFKDSDRTLASLTHEHKPSSTQAMVYLSSPSVWHNLNLPYQWAVNGDPIPEYLHLLALGINEYKITRKTQSLFSLISASTFVTDLSSTIDFDKQPLTSKLNISKISSKLELGVIANKNNYYESGQQFKLHQSDITISKSIDGQIKSFDITLRNPDNKIWQQWDWQTRKMVQVKPLQIGETRTISIKPENKHVIE